MRSDVHTIVLCVVDRSSGSRVEQLVLYGNCRSSGSRMVLSISACDRLLQRVLQSVRV